MSRLKRMGYIMINEKGILIHLYSIPNKKFKRTIIHRKDISAYPHNIPSRKFECIIINRRYLLRGGCIFS